LNNPRTHMSDNNSFHIFSGTSHKILAEELSQVTGRDLGEIRIESFPDGEIGVQIHNNVRGKDVFVVQSISKQPNDYLMELLIIVDALKRASAKSIVAVIPYFGYARQDRKDQGRVPITAKLVANLLETAGVTRVLSMDLHTPQIQGFFDIPVDDLSGRPLLIKAIKNLDLRDLVVVSPDLGSNKMARKYAEELGVEIAIVDKRRISADKVEHGALIGDVKEKNVIIVDDICSTGGTLKVAAEICIKYGAKKVFAAVTHNFADASVLENSYIEKMFTTNSIPQRQRESNKIKVVSVAHHFWRAIECVLNAKSISSLYR